MDTTMMGQHLHEINSGNVSDFIHKLHIALFWHEWNSIDCSHQIQE